MILLQPFESANWRGGIYLSSFTLERETTMAEVEKILEEVPSSSSNEYRRHHHRHHPQPLHLLKSSKKAESKNCSLKLLNSQL